MKYWRVRFYSDSNDYRPIKFPPTGPFWCSGSLTRYSRKKSKEEQVWVLVAFLKKKSDLNLYWPEAEVDEWYGKMPIEFTSRFPQPDWWYVERESAEKEGE